MHIRQHVVSEELQGTNHHSGFFMLNPKNRLSEFFYTSRYSLPQKFLATPLFLVKYHEMLNIKILYFDDPEDKNLELYIFAN